ncbi:MAG: hypothetical protein JJ992_16955, partial [Planctomycetes bacterium]|nr:hypothetical protein [Planctomycetota bacterium]
MDFLRTLGIEDFNPGAYFGNDQWSETRDCGVIESINPANGEVIASIYGASPDDYDRVRTARAENPDKWLIGGLPGFPFNIARKMRRLDHF